MDESTFGIRNKGPVSMRGTWGEIADDAAEETVRALYERTREQELKDTLCLRFVHAVKDHLREQVKWLNEELGVTDAICIEDESASSFSVSARLTQSLQRTVHVQYGKTPHRLVWTASGGMPAKGARQCDFELENESQLRAIDGSTGDPKEPWEISREILHYLGE